MTVARPKGEFVRGGWQYSIPEAFNSSTPSHPPTYQHSTLEQQLFMQIRKIIDMLTYANIHIDLILCIYVVPGRVYQPAQQPALPY